MKNGRDYQTKSRETESKPVRMWIVESSFGSSLQNIHYSQSTFNFNENQENTLTIDRNDV
jgi:hypothetical protein